jgi:hypothetical protein
VNKALVGLGAAAGVLIVMMVLRDGADGPHKMDADAAKAQSAPAGAGNTSSDLVLSIVPGAKREQSPAPPASKVSPLLKEMRAATDYRPIYERLKALPNPTAEELYVLASMLGACAKVTDRKARPQDMRADDSKEMFAASLSPKVPNRDKRIAAYEKSFRNPCGDFGGIETTENAVREMLARAAAAGDAKAQTRLLGLELDDTRRGADGEVDWSKPTSMTDEQIERFKRIVASGDPRALVDVTSLIMFNSNVHLRGPDEAPIDNQLLYYGATLAACELGYPCGPDSPYLTGGCAFQGRCDSTDYRDYLLFYELAPGNAQLAMQYQTQLLRVIRDGDWSYFTFHRGPSPIAAIIRRGK